MKFIDFRSDTVTMPTEEMRLAMSKAEVGDDVYGDDPTVKILEQKAAALVGKEAALFVPSGTMGNQLAIMTHTKRGDEIIVEENCHIVQHEVGAAAVISGVQLRIIKAEKGILTPSDVAACIREDDIHCPETGLICIENALASGTVVPLDNMKDLFNLSREHHIPIHLDGARLFNAADYLGVNAATMTQYTDSVMFCLSKGLCAPVGSILAGSKSFIDKARKNRKLLGGGMRQAGILAAAGILALDVMTKRLYIDHERAKYLAKKLAEIPGIQLNMDTIHINMVFFDITDTKIDPDKFVRELLIRGIKSNGPEKGLFRFVTNNDISRDDIDYALKAVKEIVSSTNM